jgi:hypothetical protein
MTLMEEESVGRLFVGAIVSSIIVALGADVGAQSRTPTRYICRAAKNLAVVGAWDGDGVLVVERAHDQECRFSVNGAPAGTPPVDRVVAAWNFIRGAGWTSSASFPVEALAYALSAAAPFETIAPGLSDAIAKNDKIISTCFASSDSGRQFQDSSPDVICKTSREPQRGIIRVEGSPGVEFSAPPGIQLGIRAASTVHYLFLPAPPR